MPLNRDVQEQSIHLHLSLLKRRFVSEEDKSLFVYFHYIIDSC